MLHRLVADPLIVQMPLFPWPRPSTFIVTCILVAWAGLGAAVAAGIAVRVTGALLAASIGYVVTLDQQTYSSHVYLLALTSGLLAVAHTKSGREPAVALLRWQLIIVYAFAAASKINPVFLSGLVIAANLRPVFRDQVFSNDDVARRGNGCRRGFVAWSLCAQVAAGRRRDRRDASHRVRGDDHRDRGDDRFCDDLLVVVRCSGCPSRRVQTERFTQAAPLYCYS